MTPAEAAVSAQDRLRKRARAASKKGAFEDAARHYRELLVSDDPQVMLEPRDRVEAGTAMFRSGDYKGAAWAWEAAIRQDPNNAAVAYKLGQVQMRLGKPQQALEAFSRATALAPDDANYQWSCAEVALALGEREQAKAALEATIRLDPQNQEARAAQRRLFGGVSPSGETQLAATDEGFNQLAEFIKSRPGEDQAPARSRPDQTFGTLLAITVGAIVFMALFLYVRIIVLG